MNNAYWPHPDTRRGLSYVCMYVYMYIQHIQCVTVDLVICGVYVCRYDLRGLLQRQQGTTRVLTENTVPPLLFGLCHDITSPAPPSYENPPSKYKSRPTAAFRRAVTDRGHVPIAFLLLACRCLLDISRRHFEAENVKERRVRTEILHNDKSVNEKKKKKKPKKKRR